MYNWDTIDIIKIIYVEITANLYEPIWWLPNYTLLISVYC